MTEDERSTRSVVVQRTGGSGDVFISIGSTVEIVSIDEACDIKRQLEEIVENRESEAPLNS